MNSLINNYAQIITISLLFSPGLRGVYYLYYPLLISSLIFSIPNILPTFKTIIQSKISFLIIVFNLIVGFGLIQNFNELEINQIIVTYSRLVLNIVLVILVSSCNNKFNSTRVAKYYLLVCFFASALIYIQYITGPINIFSEVASTRAGLPRYSTLSGSTNMFSISVAFSILISTFIRKKTKIFKTEGVLLIYQLFILGAAIANISRSGLLASLGVFLFSRLYLIFDRLNIDLFNQPFKIQTKFKGLKTKIKSLYFFTFLGLSVFLIRISDTLIRYTNTIVFFISGNKSLISQYSDATFESQPVLSDFIERLTFFVDPELPRNLIYEPWILIFGDGSKHFGGTIGLDRGYAHNMFLDIFLAQGLLGIFFFLFILIILFLNSFNSKINIIKYSYNIISFSIMTLFLFFCTHNSGIVFHPLSIFPLLFVQDFLKTHEITE